MTKRLLALFWILAIVCLSAEWQTVLRCRKAEGNLLFKIAGDASQEIVFRLQEEQSGRVLEFKIGRNGWFIQEILPDGRERPLEVPDAHPWSTPLPSDCEILVKLRENTWTWYCNGKFQQTLPAPMLMPGNLLWPERSGVTLVEAPQFLPVTRFEYKTDFMVEPGAPAELYPWRIRSGKWGLHTAGDDAAVRKETNLARVKQVPLSPDRSPNFYSLSGGGEDVPSVITTGYEFLDNYRYSASMQLQKGEAGLLFYHLDGAEEPQDSYYGFTLCIDAPDRAVVLWKWQDGKRTELRRQRVSLFRDQWYQPEVRVHDTEIICLLDGAELFRVPEFLPPGGKIGLYAKSPEALRFDDVNLTTFQQIEGPRGTLQWQGEIFSRYGREHHKGGVLTVRIPDAGTKILAGWRSAEEPGILWELTETESILFSAKDGQELDRFPLQASYPLDILIDTTSTKESQFLINGRLVHLLDGALPGAFGWKRADNGRLDKMAWTGINKGIWDCVRQRFEEQPQKNLVFQEDPFMRHWSSPEGKWIKGDEDILWNKGDFFGDFRLELPLVENGVLHLGVPEGAKEGSFVIKMGKDALLMGEESFPLPEGAKTWFVLVEGYWVRLYSGEKELMRRRLPTLLKESGTRVLTRGMTLEHMKASKVTRQNIVCDYFNESPHGWIINGGEWQIINRFQCQPSWSHMICQTLDGLGAVWRKQRFTGDLTVEFYAGTRHEYYNYAGNMNCTIMAKRPTPSEGYTVTNTEFDLSGSQKWSRLYKNGQEQQKSDGYFIPRRRNDMYRRVLNPLIAQGRPYHGAWFYIKLRKIGEKLEYYFDDELVFTETDPEMIQEGLVGIWTFVHSMTLAQIQITFEKVAPLPPPTLPVPVEPNLSENAQKWEVTANGFPIDALARRFWTCTDSVGHAVQESVSLDADSLRLTNCLGGGEMKLSATLPPLLLKDVAGFRFRFRRTADVRANFFFEIGRQEGEKFVPQTSCFHQLTGDDFSLGQWHCIGHTETPANEWTEVTVWIPTELRRAPDSLVRVGGFGLEQLHFETSGIHGNGPGACYEVAAFRPVFYGCPTVEMKGSLASARKERAEPRPARTGDAGQLKAQMKLCETGVENHAVVQFRKVPWSLIADVDWVNLPAVPEWQLTWAEEDDALLFTPAITVPDVRLLSIALSCGETKFASEPVGTTEKRLFRLPRNLSLTEGKPLALRIEFPSTDIPPQEIELSQGERKNHGPILMELQGLPVCELFQGEKPRHLNQNPQTQTIRPWSDGNYLHVQNFQHNQRLKNEYKFKPVVQLSQYPLLFFRYCASDMANVTLSFGGGRYVRLHSMENHPLPKTVRLSEQLNQDEQWHSWRGRVTDCVDNLSPRSNPFQIQEFEIRSIGNHDQTGIFSWLELDDILLGPAIKDAKGLAFTPVYQDLDGVARIQWRLDEGEWTDSKNNAPLSVTFPAQIEDGVHTLTIRAEDSHGLFSSELPIPFLLDRKPPEWKSTLNGYMASLTLITHDGAPLDFSKMRFLVDGKPCKDWLWTSNFKHEQNQDTTTVNLAYVFRKQLVSVPDGQSLTFKVSGLADGAGNAISDQEIQFPVNFSADKEPPKWFSITHGDRCKFAFDWDGTNFSSRPFSHGSGNAATDYHSESWDGVIVNHANGGSADVNLNKEWNLNEFPFVAFRLASPHYRKSWKLFAEIELKNGKVFTINLLQPGDAATELNKSQTFAWEEKKADFHLYQFNLGQLLATANVPEADRIVKRFSFKRTGTQNRDQLILDDFFVFRAPNAEDGVLCDLYDESGVASLEVKCGDVTKSYSSVEKIPLADFPGESPRWLTIIAVDRAGKKTPPIFVPF